MGRQLSGEEVYVFYNYHSVPFPLVGVHNLLSFVKSFLSVEDRLHFFFCCDVRQTGSELVDGIETIPSCEVVHLPYTSDDSIEKAIGNRMMELLDKDENGLVALVSEEGNYSLALDSLSQAGWQLCFFHPPNTVAAFLDVVDRAIELPVRLETTPPPPLPSPPPVEETLSGQLKNLNECLVHLLGRFSDATSAKKGDEEKSEEKREKTLGKGEEKVLEKLLKEEIVNSKPSGVKENLCVKQTLNENLMEGFKEEEKSSWEPESIERKLYETAPSSRTWNNWDAEEEEVETKKPAWNNWDKDEDDMEEDDGYGGKRDDVEETEDKGWGEPEPKFGGTRNPFGRHQNPFGGNGNKFPERSPAFEKPFEKMNPFEKTKPFQQSPPQRVQRNPFGGGGGAPGASGGFQRGSPVSENGGDRFRKPAPQCPQWENVNHKSMGSCPLWHPKKHCIFFPKCRSKAADCGYAHPFCTGGECRCDSHMKDPQLNHYCSEH